MLSIVIPCYNNWNFTRNCINNLTTLPADKFEIIIVDNASTDQTTQVSQEITKLGFSNFQYCRNQENKGFSAAVNIGISNAKGENVMILNNDIKFGNDFKNWFLELEKISQEHPNALIGPSGGYVDAQNQFAFRYETSDPNQKINYMSGWCLMASKETWNKFKTTGRSGPFDDGTYFLYFEDTQLGFESIIKKIDFHLISTPLIHIGKQTSKMIDTYKHYSKSKEKFIKKWSSQKHLF